MADQGSEFSFVRSVHVRINIRIDISISIRPITSKFGKQVHLEEFTQMRKMKQVLMTSPYQDRVANFKGYISTMRVSLAIKLGSMENYLDGLLSIKWHDPLITFSCKITWHTKTIISPLPLFLWPWPPNLAGWWLTLRGSYP